MKASMFKFCCVLISIFSSGSLIDALAADTNPPPRLTVELRDGSRVVGTSVEKNFKFHSALLGEIKLDVKDIRSVECLSSNSAKLTTVNGDSLTVSFVEPEFAVKSSFGKVELAVDSVRKFTVSAGGVSGVRHPGLVALWSAEGNANDSIGANNGVLLGGLGFTNGEVGLGFNFDGIADTVSVPASPSLDVGTGQGFTLECWIAPTSAANQEPLIEWRGDDGGINQGVQFWISVPFAGVGGPGCVFANIVDTAGGVHIFASATGLVQAGMLQHVALTYDKVSGVGKMYYNGSLVASNNLGSFTPKTDTALLFGRRADVGELYYQGMMDELLLYNRALSASEIREDYESGNQN